jgi:hypothetical protein
MFSDFLVTSLKTDVNVPTESNKQQIQKKNIFFVGILEVWRKEQDQKPDP